MKLRFTQRAIKDLADIADYIHANNPAIARRVRGAILESLQILILFPISVGGKGRKASARSSRGKYRYVVYYAVMTRQKKCLC